MPNCLQPKTLRPEALPVLHMYCTCTAGEGVRVDICLGNPSAVAAAGLLAPVLAAAPALRPLCLVLKAFLHQHELGRQGQGGLASHAAVLLVSMG